MKKLYFDITSGISGDMALASLAGLYPEGLAEFEKIISKVVNSEVKLSITHVYRSGINCNQLVIDCDCSNAPFRHYTDIVGMINAAELSDSVKEKSIHAFRLIAEAESIAHGIDIERVHFHEVGAVDTLIDIIGVAWFIDKLGVSEVTAYEAICGTGTINIAHGVVPLPVPAVVKILKDVPFKQIDVQGELTTPTGAAILKAFVHKFHTRVSGTIEGDCFSTGTKEYANATNMLRAVLFEDVDCHDAQNSSRNDKRNTDNVLVLESNIDDMTGEAMGTLLDKLMSAGALDVSYTPIIMKKNRPAYALTVIAPIELGEKLTRLVFKYSTTCGLRKQIAPRVVMAREFVEADVMGEIVKVKHLSYEDVEKFAPEWDNCVSVAEKLRTTPTDIYEKAITIVKGR